MGTACLLWALLGIASVTACFAQDRDLPDLRFEQAEFVASDDVEPPQDGWRALTLPDHWARNHPRLDGIAWYRLRFFLDTVPTQALALYVPRVAVTAELRLNGSVLNPEVRFTPPGGHVGTQMTNRPQFLTLPTGLFSVGENVLHIRVQGNPVTGGTLSAIQLGSPDKLRTAWRWREIPQHVIPQALFVLMSVTLAFALMSWWRSRGALHRHFALVMVLWTALVGSYLWGDLPLTRTGLAAGLALLLIGFHWALLGLCWRFSGSTWYWFPGVLNVTSALMLVAGVGMALSGHLLERLGWLLLPSLALRTLTTVMLAQWAWRERSPRALSLLGAEVIWFAGTAQFLAIRLGWLPAEPFMLTPADSFPLFLVLLYNFGQHLILERGQAAREQQAAIDAERARIMHDMHDGIGSQLITALRLARQPGVEPALVARSVDTALQDLRLIIDSLDLADHDLLPLLGNLRYRLQPQLAALGIRLEWQVQALPALTGLTPPSALAVLRIVQEALNNAARHARPSVITVTIDGRDGGVRIDVADDGCGFDAGMARPGGRGLAGMHQRAERLHAQLSVGAREGGGSIVSLWLPPESITQSSPGAA